MSAAADAGAYVATAPTGFIQTVEHWVLKLVEFLAATALAAEIVVLASGVFARYVMHAPLVWSDELASILFLWLAMLGSILAFQRNQHMRMTALVDTAGPALRASFEVVALVASLVFLLVIFPETASFAHEEGAVVTPALEIPGVIRAAALPLGIGLMLFFAVARLARTASLRTIVLTAVAIAAAVALLVVAKPMFVALGNLNLLIFFVGFIIVGVFLGVPIGFVFGLAAFSYIGLTTSMPLTVIAGRLDEGMSHLILLAVPLFVFLGLLMDMTGMARAMVGFLGALLGHVRGGLSYVLIGAMYLVSGISGSKAADMAAIAPALFPEMKRRGAKPGELVALLAATGAQTETIPPSLVLITIGSVTSVSIAALFTGGLMPALVVGLVITALVWWRHRGDDMSGVKRAPLAEIGKTFLLALPALALPFIIRAAVVEGVATATEVSTIGIVYCAIVGILIYRRFEWRALGRMLVDTASLSGAILFIIGAATAVAWCLTQSGFSRDLASMMKALPGGAPMFLFVSIVAFTILGSVLEGIPALVLFAPLVFPIARSVGVHEVHYSMVVILAMGIGLFLPPFGVGYYSACAIGRADPKEGIKPLMGYVGALFIGLVLVAVFPWISIGFL